MSSSTAGQPGRPRSDLDAMVYSATLATINDVGYVGATMDRIAAASGIAKTTLYRRWPSKSALVTDCLVAAFGEAPMAGSAERDIIPAAVRWTAAKIGEPGLGAAFAGVFSEAIGDSSIRDLLVQRLQEPYRVALQAATGEPDQRVLLLVDIVVGTLLHRLGISGEPMATSDVEELIAILRGAAVRPTELRRRQRAHR